jgi:prepilin-type N-terminal cleavage/methylation domain-containing protein/prepilin-type processing-associated H-X9-DG protein
MTHRIYSSNPRTAFTLVELLVVIAIIGSLMGLLLPAIQSAREAGRRNTCMNNVSQLGKSIFLHDNEMGGIPGWRNKMTHTDNSGGFTIVGWPIKLFPYLERRDLYRVFEAGQATAIPDNTAIALFQCPSSPPDADDEPYLSYVVNAGSGSSKADTASASQFPVLSGDGVFFDAYGTNGSDGKKLTLDAISAGDGTTTTLAFTEQNGSAKSVRNSWNNYARGQDVSKYISGIWATDMAVNGDKNLGNVFVHRGIAENSFSTVGSSSVAFADPSATGPNKVVNPSVATANPGYYPSSNHSGGVIVGYADGHTAMLKETVSNLVYAQLMTSNGPNSRFAGQNELDRLPVLDEGDLTR